ncbi:hypothetical protein ACFLXP_02040 [Chloroflexota bacterium]
MEEKNLIRKFVTSVKCTVCEQYYAAESVKILGHQENLWLLNLSCPSCQTQRLVAAVIKENKTAKVITDLTKAEFIKFREIDKPNTDDILDMNIFLRNFDGDFSRLFR